MDVDTIARDVSEFAVLLWTAGRTDRVNGWDVSDFLSALRWASDLQAAAARVHPSLRANVDKRLMEVLASTAFSMPAVFAQRPGVSVLDLLAGEDAVEPSHRACRKSEAPRQDQTKDVADGVRGARMMLLHAIVHNVHFDWKASWVGKRGYEETSAVGGASLFGSALREFALHQSRAQYMRSVPEGPKEKRQRVQVSTREHEGVCEGGNRRLTEEAAAAGARVLATQTRKQGEADLLLMCCNRLSQCLPRDFLPRSPRHTNQNDAKELQSCGWWTCPSAIRSRSMARLVLKSAASSPGGEELIRSIEGAMKQPGEIESRHRGAGMGMDVKGGAQPGSTCRGQNEATMLHVCLWAIVLPETGIPSHHSGTDSGDGEEVKLAGGGRHAHDGVLVKGSVSAAAVRRRLVQSLLHSDVRRALMCAHPWLLSHAAAAEGLLCAAVVHEARVTLLQGIEQLVASAGALHESEVMDMMQATCDTMRQACGLVSHMLLAGEPTRAAVAEMLEVLVGELGEVLSALLARSVLSALVMLEGQEPSASLASCFFSPSIMCNLAEQPGVDGVFAKWRGSLGGGSSILQARPCTGPRTTLGGGSSILLARKHLAGTSLYPYIRL